MNINTHTKRRLLIFGLLLSAGVAAASIYGAHVAHAAADGVLGTAGNVTAGQVLPNNIIVGLATILAVILKAISLLLWPLIMFAGGLMKSDFLYTGAIDIKLTEMWIQVRNLVNIIYVILLLAVALYNVLGLGETVDFLEIKKALPKIILGLLLVNFSYLGVKVVLDVVNVGTTFAFSIPRTDPALNIETQKTLIAAGKNFCNTFSSDGASAISSQISNDPAMKAAAYSKCDSDFSKDAAKAASCKSDIDKGATSPAIGSKYICVEDKTPGAAPGTLVPSEALKTLLSDFTPDSALMIIAMKFMKMQDLGSIAKQIQEQGVTVTNLTINMLFGVVMYLAYGVSFVTLTIVLFARAAILWMVIVFSPLIVLNMTFPNILESAGGGAGEFPKKVISTLIAPIIIGFVLSIGYILLSTLQNINGGGVTALISDVPSSNLDTFQNLMIAIGSIVFIWMGVEGASSGAIGGSVAGTVMQGAQSAGAWLAKAPFVYTPFFSIKSPHETHGELVGLGTLSQALKIGKDSFEQKHLDEGRKLATIMGFGPPPALDALKTADGIKKWIGATNMSELGDANKKDFLEAVSRAEKSGTLRSTSTDLGDKSVLKIKDLLTTGKKEMGDAEVKGEFEKIKRMPAYQAGASGGETSIASAKDMKDKKAQIDIGSTHLATDEKPKVSKLENVNESDFVKAPEVDKKLAQKAYVMGKVQVSVSQDTRVTELLNTVPATGTLTDDQKKKIEEIVKDAAYESDLASVDAGGKKKDIIKAGMASAGVGKPADVLKKITDQIDATK